MIGSGVLRNCSYILEYVHVCYSCDAYTVTCTLPTWDYAARLSLPSTYSGGECGIKQLNRYIVRNHTTTAAITHTQVSLEKKKYRYIHIYNIARLLPILSPFTSISVCSFTVQQAHSQTESNTYDNNTPEINPNPNPNLSTVYTPT